MKLKNYYKNLSRFPKRSSNDAVGLIEECLKSTEKYKNNRCKYNDRKVIKQIISIYQSVPKQCINHSLFNQMLRAHLHFEDSPQRVELTETMWNDLLQDTYSSDFDYTLLLKVICNNNDIEKLLQILEWMKESEEEVLNLPFDKILSLLIQHGHLQKAIDFFNSVDDNFKSDHMIVSMLKMNIQNDCNESALALYEKYCDRNNDIMHLFGIKACGNLFKYQKGTQIHSKIQSKVEENIKLRNALIVFYGQCNDLDQAMKLFEGIPNKQMNVKSIGCMMQIFIEQQLYEKALEIYDKHAYLQDDICHLLAIKACSNCSNHFEKGKEIHKKIKVLSIELISALIEFYGNFNDIQSAMHLFESVQHKNIICIGAMMKSYLNCGQYTKCIELFGEIETKYGLKPNIICYDIVLDAATKDTAYHFGMSIHQKLKQNEKDKWMLNEVEIATNLINMYGKCGKMERCKQIWNEIKNKETSVLVWNAMINAYGRNGDWVEAKEYFEQLKNVKHIKPNRSTFILMINAFGHAGKETDAYNIWLNEIFDDEIKYDSFVITALVDCFARKGMVNKAYDIVKEYEQHRGAELHSNDEKMWMSLLSGARQQKDGKLVKQMFEEIQGRYTLNIHLKSIGTDIGF